MNKAKTIVLGLMLIVFSVTTLLSQETIRLMTYNIKLDYPKEGENSWNNRKDWMLGQIQFYRQASPATIL